PYAPLVKERFEPQQYPELRESPGGARLRPYDVTGWTLPVQMGVETAPVTPPVKAEDRAALERVKTFSPLPGKVDGAGGAYVLSHRPNAAFKAINGCSRPARRSRSPTAR